jgi:hypothetical protein
MFAISARSRQHQPANSPSASPGRVTPGPEDLRASHRPGTPSQLRRIGDRSAAKKRRRQHLSGLTLRSARTRRVADASGRPQTSPGTSSRHRRRSTVLHLYRNDLLGSPGSASPHRRGGATQVPLATGQASCSIFEKSSYSGAPLRNRTVDLLLTMDIKPPSDQAINEARKHFYLRIHGQESPDVAGRRWPMAPKNGPHSR